jgi:hypothetical protein
MPKKSPIRHKVVSHTRKHRHVRSYFRGSGKPEKGFFMGKDKAKPKNTTLPKPSVGQTTFFNYESTKSKIVSDKIQRESEDRRREREFDEQQANEERRIKELINSKPKVKERLEYIISDFSKNIDKGLVFYSWVQSPLKSAFGKNYPHEYFSYCVDKLRKLGYNFTMD